MYTEDYINELLDSYVRLADNDKEAITNYWGDYIPNCFTKQDVWEQTRKIIKMH